jgi:hypothetical protein
MVNRGRNQDIYVIGASGGQPGPWQPALRMTNRQSILFTKLDESGSDLMLVENFR